MTGSLLDISGLGVEMGGRRVLHDVDLRIGPGELVGLIGPNGAGKTTLLRAILTLVPTSTGRISVGGTAPHAARGSIGYVPQRHEFAWDFPISVEKAVLTGRTHRMGWVGRPGRTDRDAVAAALDQVGLTALRSRPIGELSGGQRQRVLVARALALQPPLLLLDEPLTGLDVPSQQSITGLLRRLRHEKAVLMTTHDLPAAAAICTRLCLLNETVIADAPPEQLREPGLWLRAFGVAQSDDLLHTLGAAPR